MLRIAGRTVRPRYKRMIRASRKMRRTASIHEHHGLAAVEDDAILQMMAHRARQHAALDIAALADEVFGRIAVTDALDVLIDDRAFIEGTGDVMRGGADQFDAALMRLMVGPRALEARQER